VEKEPLKGGNICKKEAKMSKMSKKMRKLKLEE
jgi:hypothetical protein